MNEQTNELLAFFKALGEASRLKIIGILAQDEHSVEELAALLDLRESTVSHHLSVLAKAGLVSARAEGYYSMFRLELEPLRAMATRLLAKGALPAFAQDVDLSAYDRKVLAAYMGPDGKLHRLPAQEKKFQVVLRYALQRFKPGKRYKEKQVNQILVALSEDTASLRRGFIEYKLMQRANGEYWRTDNAE